MSKLAIDIVLLPPDEVMDVCIKINPNLNKIDRIPHISLLMGVTTENEIENIKEKIKKIANTAPLKLEIPELVFFQRPDGTTNCYFKIKKDDNIQSLHETIIEQVSPELLYDASLEMFYKDKNETLDQLSTFWVNKFLKEFSLENFNPHITLKTSQAEYNNLPIKFTTTRLAICQLGNYCTCRKILYETSLQP